MATKIASLYAEIGADTTKLEAGLKTTKTGLTGIAGGLNDVVKQVTGFNLAQISAAGAVIGLGKAIIDAGNETVAYGAQVRDLARISGTSAEQTSRLIQTADDLKVSYETLTQAARGAAQKGIALTTDALAKLSDQYLAMTDPAARAKFALDNFGRSGLEMTKVLEAGGAALREMAASQSSTLIMTQAQVDQARNFEKAQDAVNDTLTGFKYTVGNAVLPAITSFIKGIDDLLNSEARLTEKHKQEEAAVFKSAKTYEEYSDGIDKLNGPMVQQQNNLAKQYGATTQASTAVKKLTEAEWNMKPALDAIIAAAPEAGGSIADFGYDMEDATKAADRLSKSLQSNLSVGISLAESNKNFEDSYWGIQNSIVTLTQSIDVMEKMKYRTPEQEEALKGMREDLGKQQAAMDALTKQHTIDTNKMIFNMLLQRAASDGLTTAEFNNFMKLGVGMGILTQKDADMAIALNGINLDDANATLDETWGIITKVGGAADTTASSVEGAAGRMNKIKTGVLQGELAPVIDQYGRVQSATNAASQDAVAAAARMNEIKYGVLMGQLAPVDQIQRQIQANEPVMAAELEAAAARMNAINMGVAMGQLAPVDAIIRSIMGQPSEKTITITTRHIDEYSESGDHTTGHHGEMNYANGGSFVIPMKYGFEGYPLGPGKTASGGETVTVTPPGKSPSGGAAAPFQIIVNTNMDYEKFLTRVKRDLSAARMRA